MKKDYTMANGKTVELDVTAEINEILVKFERRDKNEKRNKRRRNEASVEGMFEETGWEPTDKTVNIERDYDESEEKETLADAITGLNERQKLIVQLHYYEEKTEREIAALLGVSQPAVNKQLAVIHKTLRKYFEKL